MFNLNHVRLHVGVLIKSVYEVKVLDNDFFDAEEI